MIKSALHICIFLALLIINVHCNSQSPTKAEPSFYSVTRIIDGDTFYINDSTKKEGRIRLIGIDAPESRKSQNKQVGYFGKEASDYVSRLLKGKTVRLEYDVSRKDKYGRTLAYAYLEDGTFLNAHLIEQGYAILLTIPPNVKFADEFHKLQQIARKNKRGLWGKP